MSDVGHTERKTQNRIINLFQDQLHYEYLGNWQDREDNQAIEENYLSAYLTKCGYSKDIIKKAVFELKRTAYVQNKSLYDVNKEIYSLLRYGLKIKPDLSENSLTVELIDWKYPENNHFAIAEEVTVSGKHNKRPDLVIYVNGIAIGVIELKRSTVSVAEGIRQNIDSQKPEFIQHFFQLCSL